VILVHFQLFFEGPDALFCPFPLLLVRDACFEVPLERKEFHAFTVLTAVDLHGEIALHKEKFFIYNTSGGTFKQNGLAGTEIQTVGNLDREERREFALGHGRDAVGAFPPRWRIERTNDRS